MRNHSSFKQKPVFARVALPIPVDKLFTYSVPGNLADQISVGCRIEVPFGRRILSGIVIELIDESDVKNTKDVSKNCGTSLSPNLLKLAGWMASYYGCSLGEAALSVLPPSLKKPRVGRYIDKMVVLKERPADGTDATTLSRTPKQLELLRALAGVGGSATMRSVLYDWGYSRACLKGLITKGYAAVSAAADVSPLAGLEEDVVALTDEQNEALAPVKQAIKEGGFHAFLLYGVTGSGKTEVYLRAAEHVLSEGGGCIVLVPEIGLLPQAIVRYKRLFEEEVAIVHSRLTGVERYAIWERVKVGDHRLVLGPRSALFSPVKNLKLIIVDEEQDDSYKQEEKPRYHARNVALMRGKFENLTVLLGSATPSAESFQQVQRSRYTYLALPERIKGVPLPLVHVVDMRLEAPENGIFAHLLLEKLDECLSKGYQSILFLNKRGHARFVRCNSCGWVARCKNCDISLTYHRVGRKLRCHFCGFALPAAAECPQCMSTKLCFSGIGTQRVETDLKGLFPGIGVLRMDADTTSGKEGHRRILERFSTGRYQILLGTQMVAKGHHFPGVHLVGILSAEEELNFPDFRSAERTFQQLIQASGRAGRKDKRGEVLVQTYIPEHSVFAYLKTHDYVGFMNEELKVRKKLGYPPFSRLIAALCSCRDEKVLKRVINSWTENLRNIFAKKTVTILGPTPPLVPRLKGKFREQVIIKGTLSPNEKSEALESFARISGTIERGKTVDLKWDVDPQAFF